MILGTMFPDRLRWFRIWLLVLATVTAVVAAPRPESSGMPRKEDFTVLWWENGPQWFLTMTNPAPEPILCLRSGTIGVRLDTATLDSIQIGRLVKSSEIAVAMMSDGVELVSLPKLPLALTLQSAGKTFRCIGRPPLTNDWHRFPVRFIESGRFFQRVAIESLRFEDASGAEWKGTARIELSLWPDRCGLLFEVEPAEGKELLAIKATVGNRQVSTEGSGKVATNLELVGDGKDPSVRIEGDKALQFSFSRELDCNVVRLPESPWNNPNGTYYPDTHLDRLDRWPISVRNDTGVEQVVRLQFVQEHHIPITGFTPLLCDELGRPTGIPVQISKNWHLNPALGFVKHQGPWFHGFVFLRMPPRSERRLQFSMVYARYGGIPAASHAQLSLVGWGHNQFWDQAAIGSFGESICYEPGRIQRRCFIDDVRPLLTLARGEPKRYGWSENAGGGDFLVWFDHANRYQGFRATKTDYRAYGPCLTDVVYSERTLGGEMTAVMSVSIARSDDFFRCFHRFRYEVLKPISWRRLAFYQWGSDYYNATPARFMAVGDRSGLRDEWQPTAAPGRFDRQSIALTGPAPWISMHGVKESEVPKGAAVASRGLVVRSWRAVMNGQPQNQPHASFFVTEWGKGNRRTSVELSPPPGVKSLEPGDFIEGEVESVVFPAIADHHYGPDKAFAAALSQKADTWKLVHAEAAANDLKVDVEQGEVERAYPLKMKVDKEGRAKVTVEGGAGYLPVSIGGLSSPVGHSLNVDGRRLDQSIHGNDFWQTDYDSLTKTWSVTFNVGRHQGGKATLELITDRNAK